MLNGYMKELYDGNAGAGLKEEFHVVDGGMRDERIRPIWVFRPEIPTRVMGKTGGEPSARAPIAMAEWKGRGRVGTGE
jgi:hypothetical protein